MNLPEAHDFVRAYSTTWYVPITSMPAGLNESTTCAYLCMRAIDEIEDHPSLDAEAKVVLLRAVSRLFQTRFGRAEAADVFAGYATALPEVTVRLGEWAQLAPADIRPRVLDTFSAMAERMAGWVESGFAIHDEIDLDRYTYAVAGTLVLLLSDLWAWHDGTRSDRTHAVEYGRGLQAVNILIDRDVDSGRGVDFWPDNWDRADMVAYAERELVLADAYLAALPDGPARGFCAVPLARAHRALAEQKSARA
ncbi:squalene/phytoene synthase family protein [Nocardia sp. NPDC057030]|uniref:squalene/phytoene synthase family protein n=1 Tax=unclassified Nocardia TaxID=2637762 RepID=UPI0036381080